jgi:FKBP12-rapamycin complex-associated protein
VSPELLRAHHLELAVPGTYHASREVIAIERFAPSIKVMNSKQRPRRLAVFGSDGIEYGFLLKGHEDLRQDERVMQLFGLVNTLLGSTEDCARLDLGIHRYSVVPLSTNSGLIEWVPQCDTLHALVRDYRVPRSILLNVEHRLMLHFAPDLDNLAKAVLDGCNGVVFEDDRQVVKLCLTKRYAQAGRVAVSFEEIRA